MSWNSNKPKQTTLPKGFRIRFQYALQRGEEPHKNGVLGMILNLISRRRTISLHLDSVWNPFISIIPIFFPNQYSISTKFNCKTFHFQANQFS